MVDKMRWIPVSEGNPPRDGKFLVTIQADGYRFVSWAWFRNGIWKSNVIAWMKVPRPYDEGINAEQVRVEGEMNYKGKPLEELTRAELIAMCERLAAEVRMVASTVPDDIMVTDIADLLPQDSEPWQPPRIAGMLYKGVGKPGGR